MIGIINYGMGNIGSLVNMLKHIGVDAKVISSAEEMQRVDKVILPGVGSFDAAINEIKSRYLDEALSNVVGKGNYVLGICLGMQLLTKSSKEGVESGFGWIDAEALSFRALNNSDIRVPHMGWNVVHPAKENPLISFEEIEENRFYFVHSYYVKCKEKRNSLGGSCYGIEFDSVIGNENVLGVQFHPEKSHKFGMRLLKKFSEL